MKTKSQFSKKNHILDYQGVAKQRRRDSLIALKGLNRVERTFQSRSYWVSHLFGFYFFCLRLLLSRHDKRKQKRKENTHTHKHTTETSAQTTKKKGPKKICSAVIQIMKRNCLQSSCTWDTVSAKYRQRREFITGTAEFNFGLKGSIDTRWWLEIFPARRFNTRPPLKTLPAVSRLLNSWQDEREEKNKNAALPWLAKRTSVGVGQENKTKTTTHAHTK